MNFKDALTWKKNPGFLVFLFLTVIAYLYYVIFQFKVTPASYLNLAIAVTLLLGLLCFWYIVLYHWVEPELKYQNFHRIFQSFTISIMASMAIAIWFIQNETIFPAFQDQINRTMGRIILDLDPTMYSWLTFYLLLSILIPTFLICIIVIKKVTNEQFLPISKIQWVIYALMLVSVTTCIYSTDFLEISPGEQSVIYWGGTEDYVRYRIRNTEEGFFEDLKNHGGFLYGQGPNSTAPVRDYLSFTGFYGTIMKLIQTITKIDPEKMLIYTRILFAFLTACIFTALSLLLKQKAGILASATFSAFTMITYWFIGPSTHLIWFFPTMFIPLLLGIFLYPRVLEGKMPMRQYLIWVFVGQVFVFLRSYVYAPVLLLSAAVPPFFFNIKAKQNVKKILWNGISICLVGTLALGLVLAIHLIQLSLYFDSIEQAFQYLIGKSEERGVTTLKHADSVSQLFRKWMNGVKVFYFSKRVTSVVIGMEEWVQDGWNTFKTLHLVVIIISLIAAILQWFTRKGLVILKDFHSEINNLFTLSIASLAATLSSWSWFPALGHMSDHYHMNGIMYMILMGLFLFALIGVFLQTSIHLMVSVKKKTN